MNHSFFDFEVYQSPNTDIPSELLTGQNEKNLLLVLNKEDFSPENEQFLTKILAAVKYDLNNDALSLLLPKSSSFGINDVVNREDIKQIILFGINPKEIGFSIEPIVYTPFSLLENQYLITHSLEKIRTTQELKKALWAALQQMFLS